MGWPAVWGSPVVGWRGGGVQQQRSSAEGSKTPRVNGGGVGTTLVWDDSGQDETFEAVIKWQQHDLVNEATTVPSGSLWSQKRPSWGAPPKWPVSPHLCVRATLLKRPLSAFLCRLQQGLELPAEGALLLTAGETEAGVALSVSRAALPTVLELWSTPRGGQLPRRHWCLGRACTQPGRLPSDPQQSSRDLVTQWLWLPSWHSHSALTQLASISQKITYKLIWRQILCLLPRDITLLPGL